VIDTYEDMPVVLAGDMNFDFLDHNSGFQVFKQWMEDFSMSSIPMDVSSPTAYTFCSSSGCSSYIDHVVVSSNLSQSVLSIRTLDSGSNLSDHFIIIIIIIIEKTEAGLERPLYPRNRYQITSTCYIILQ